MQEGSTVNQKLRAVREQKMWTIEEAAEAVGVDVQTYWRWEHAVQRPRAYALRKLCSVFDRSAEELGFGRSSDTHSQTQSTAVQQLEETVTLLSSEMETHEQALVRLTPEQAEALLVLLRNETAMKQFDPTKRATLHTLGKLLKDIALVTGSSMLVGEWMGEESVTNLDPWERLVRTRMTPSALNTATLDHFTNLLSECWKLTDLNELTAAEGILSRFLPTIVAIPFHDVTAPMANLASQGLRLLSILVHHRLDTSHKVLICQQAVEYARYAGDINTLVTALIELAAAYKFEGQLDKRLCTLQEALGYSVQATPLVQSRAYSNSASALAESGRIAEAQLYMSLARDIFPDDPGADPGYAFADSNLFTLSYHAGKVYTNAGNISEAFAAFDLYQQYAPDTTIPERIRLEIINAQSRAAIHANNLEQYAMFVDNALSGALALGSRKRFTEAYRIFQREMPRDWLATRQIQALVEQYHLERKE